MTSIYSSVEEVRNLTGLSSSDISDGIISGIIQHSTSQLNADCQIKWSEQASYISAEKKNEVNGSNRVFYLRHYPIGDRDDNGLISGADVYCYAIDGAGAKRQIIVSGITGDGPDPASTLGGPLWLSTANNAPQTDERLYFTYFSAPLDVETPHRLITLATTQLAAALCFTRVDVGKVQSFRVGKIAVTRQSDAFNIYRKLYENSLNSIRQEMFKTAETEYTI